MNPHPLAILLDNIAYNTAGLAEEIDTAPGIDKERVLNALDNLIALITKASALAQTDPRLR
jgi:hypothetical protein